MRVPKNRIEVVDSGETTRINWRGKVKIVPDISRFYARVFQNDELTTFAWGATEQEAVELATERLLEVQARREAEAHPKVIEL